MKKLKDINKKLDKDIPDLKLSIVTQIDWNAVKENNNADNVKVRATNLQFEGGEVVQSTKSKKNIMIIVAAVLMMAVFIIVLIFTLLPIGGGSGNNGFEVTISVTEYSTAQITANNKEKTIKNSPKIALSVDNNDVVTAQNALNSSAAEILIGVRFVGAEYKQATTDIIKLADSLGYITATDIVNIYASGGVKNDHAKVSEITAFLDKHIMGLNFGVMTEEEFDKIEDQLDDFDEDAFTQDAMIKLLAGVKVELASKILINKNIIENIDYILSSQTNTKKLAQNYYQKNDDLIPPEALEDLSEMLKIHDSSYGTEYYEEISNNKTTYSDIAELKEELLEELEELKEIEIEINEITDINDLDGEYKDAIEDLLEIVKDDIFDRD